MREELFELARRMCFVKYSYCDRGILIAMDGF